MSRPEQWRLNASAYPFAADLPTRWADLDLLGHINNVAMAGLFEEGRVHFNRALDLERQSRDIRWLVAGVALNYLAEAHYPDAVSIASGIGLSAADHGSSCQARSRMAYAWRLATQRWFTPTKAGRWRFQRVSGRSSRA